VAEAIASQRERVREQRWAELENATIATPLKAVTITEEGILESMAYFLGLPLASRALHFPSSAAGVDGNEISRQRS
jgi:hypothetical protein